MTIALGELPDEMKTHEAERDHDDFSPNRVEEALYVVILENARSGSRGHGLTPPKKQRRDEGRPGRCTACFLAAAADTHVKSRSRRFRHTGWRRYAALPP